MIVVDASVLADAICDAGGRGQAARSALAGRRIQVPDLAYIEVASVIRGLGRAAPSKVAGWTADLVDSPWTPHSGRGLVGRALELRHNLSAYDATYVALAEALDCPLLLSDLKAGRGAVGARCQILTP